MKTENLKSNRPLGSCNRSALSFNEEISEKIDLVGSPFFQNIGITHFGYIKIFNNGTMFRMANNKKWTREYFEREYYNDIIYNMKDVSKDKRRLLLLTGEPQGEHFTSLCKNFDIWNALAIYEKFNEYGEFWFFGTSRQNTEAIDFYINNLFILKKFISYFKDKFSEELKKINTKNMIFSNIEILNIDNEEKKNVSNFFNEINANSYKISEELSISKKEFKCLALLVQGKTAKEIARLMGRSFRTIEFHLNNVKKKANCKKKSHLIDLLLSNRTFFSLLDKF